MKKLLLAVLVCHSVAAADWQKAAKRAEVWSAPDSGKQVGYLAEGADYQVVKSSVENGRNWLLVRPKDKFADQQTTDAEGWVVYDDVTALDRLDFGAFRFHNDAKFAVSISLDNTPVCWLDPGKSCDVRFSREASHDFVFRRMDTGVTASSHYDKSAALYPFEICTFTASGNKYRNANASEIDSILGRASTEEMPAAVANEKPPSTPPPISPTPEPVRQKAVFRPTEATENEVTADGTVINKKSRPAPSP